MEFFWQKRLNERKIIENKSSNQEANGVKEHSSSDAEENLFVSEYTTFEYLETNEWENISFSEEEEQIVAYFENGTRISSSTDAENFIVLRNKETGEVIISGGENLIVTGSDDKDTLALKIAVMPTLVLRCVRKLESSLIKKLLVCGIMLFSVFMVIGRLVSGVHWLTDIIGSVILSAGLFFVYKSAVLLCVKN